MILLTAKIKKIFQIPFLDEFISMQTLLPYLERVQKRALLFHRTPHGKLCLDSLSEYESQGTDPFHVYKQ